MDKYNRTEISLGLKPNISSIYKYGASEVGTVFEPVWDKGGAYHWMTIPTKLQIVSGSASDTNGGAGAWKVKIYGLDENWLETSEEVILNGITPVETINTYIRCFRAYVIEAGNSIGLYGALSIYETGSPLNVVAQVDVGKNQTHMAIYTTPANKVSLICNADANVGQGKEATVEFMAKNNENGQGADLVKATRYLYQNSFLRVYASPRKIAPKTDIWMRAKTTTGTVSIAASFEIGLFNKSYYKL